jgi:hypothetical protein
VNDYQPVRLLADPINAADALFYAHGDSQQIVVH